MRPSIRTPRRPTRFTLATGARAGLTALAAFGAAAAGAGCGSSPPGRTFYERNIEPILTQRCSKNTSGCHSTNTDDPFQFAAGNFDVTSFANVQKRHDVLAPFGAYPYPLLLIKAVGPGALSLNYGTDPMPLNNVRSIDVQHSGGAILSVNSDAFLTLQNWLQNGATEDGLAPPTPPQVGSGPCSHAIPSDFDMAAFSQPAQQASFTSFKTNVQPIINRHGCNAGSCHGAPQSDFYVTCGSTDQELVFNFSQAWSFVNTPVDDSQLLRVPLAVGQGGRGHTGGDQFASTTDKDYLAIRTWAAQAGTLVFAQDPARKFFADNIQPILLQRGCSFQACHSPGATNDFKLRSGTLDFFSSVALEKNYELLRNNFMALEFPDARRGRAVSKALVSGGAGAAGITHRGGPVLETQGATSDPALCPAFTVADAASPPDAPPFCRFQEWLTIERANAAAAGQITSMTDGDTAQIVYIERASASATHDRLSFDSFEPGADLRLAQTPLFSDPGELNQGKFGSIDPVGDTRTLLTSCGLGGSPDIQSPDVANDGNRVVFAGRASAADPLEVYLVTLNDLACKPVTLAVADANGLKVHNFDPAFSPDGNWVVFASTRGKSGVGPTLSRKRFLPQSDLWRVAVNGTTVDQTSYEQLTFLSNSEVSPHFMREGRITMTTEKTSDGFYQLSGRRLNWDLTDYHPLLAQRAISPYASLTDLTATKPSIGYAAATDIREGSDGSFLLILSDVNADGSPVSPGAAGALGIFNRSIGPFEADRTDPGFLQSLHVLGPFDAQMKPLASGHAGAQSGYRWPVALPSGEIMASYASNVASGNFDIVAVDPNTGNQRALFKGGDGKVRVDAVLVYAYPPRTLYENRRQLVFGGSVDNDPAHAVLHMPDAPMVFTLLTGNLRRGRPVDAFRSAKFLAVYSEGLCPAGSCSAGPNGIYEKRTLLGTAPLAGDGSVRVQLPSGTGVILELQDGSHKSVVQMGEEHQLGPGEQISMGISQSLFDVVCAGCHGSVSGAEIDVGVSPDALTGASSSQSATATPAVLGP